MKLSSKDILLGIIIPLGIYLTDKVIDVVNFFKNNSNISYMEAIQKILPFVLILYSIWQMSRIVLKKMSLEIQRQKLINLKLIEYADLISKNSNQIQKFNNSVNGKMIVFLRDKLNERGLNIGDFPRIMESEESDLHDELADERDNQGKQILKFITDNSA